MDHGDNLRAIVVVGWTRSAGERVVETSPTRAPPLFPQGGGGGGVGRARRSARGRGIASDSVAGHVVVKTEEAKPPGTWAVATAAPCHAMGNCNLLCCFAHTRILASSCTRPAGCPCMSSSAECGNVLTNVAKNVVLPDVWYVPRLRPTLFLSSSF